MKKRFFTFILLILFSISTTSLNYSFANEYTENILNTVATVSSKTVNIRKGPSLNEKIVHTGRVNQVVLLKEKKGDNWYKVEFPNGAVGWCEGKNLKEFKYFNEDSLYNLSQDDVDKTIDKVIEIAKKQLGKPYVWASVGPNEFDCSGLMLYSYKQGAGVELSDYSAEQAVKGVYVKKDKLKKGDLVFFDTMNKGRVSHVGIYIGNGKFIHAANSKVGVILSNLSDKKYAPKYIAARRIIIPNQKPINDWENHWANKNISLAMDNIWVEKSNLFRPNSYITRAEFVKIFNRVYGLKKSSGVIFNDTINHWASYDIDIAVTNNVCFGKSNTEFKPNDFITREEAAVMISNYNKLYEKNLGNLSKFNDHENISSWAKQSVGAIIEYGYMLGYSDNTFRPKNNITRAEAVVTLSRLK